MTSSSHDKEKPILHKPYFVSVLNQIKLCLIDIEMQYISIYIRDRHEILLVRIYTTSIIIAACIGQSYSEN